MDLLHHFSAAAYWCREFSPAGFDERASRLSEEMHAIGDAACAAIENTPEAAPADDT